MSIQLDYTPVLNSKEFKTQLKTNSSFNDLNEIELRKAKFNRSDGKNDKSLGKIKDDEPRPNYPNEDPMGTEPTRWRIPVEFCTEYYRIRPRNGGIEARTNIVVPRIVDFEIEVKVRLLLSKKLNTKQQLWIQTVFDQFSGSSETDFYTYIAGLDSKRKELGIGFEDFDIISYGKVDKLDDKLNIEQRQWLKKQFESSELTLDKTKCLDDLTPIIEHPERQGKKPEEIHNNLRTTPEKNPCDNMRAEIKPKKAGTLLTYPEFKIIMRRKVIKIGCSKVVFHWPELNIRWTDNELWYSAWSRDQLGQYIENMASECLENSAKVALVTAISTQNILAALALFRTLVEACIYLKIGQKMECFFPELFLKLNSGNWKPV